MLRALAGDAVILADGQRQLAVVAAAHEAVERKQVLHGTLAERLLPDDDPAVVILDSGREDLRGARAEAVDEHTERTGVDRRRARIVELLDRAPRLAQLDD